MGWDEIEKLIFEDIVARLELVLCYDNTSDIVVQIRLKAGLAHVRLRY